MTSEMSAVGFQCVAVYALILMVLYFMEGQLDVAYNYSAVFHCDEF